MTNAIGTRENIKIIESNSCGGLKVEVMEYDKLLGTTNTNAVVDMYYMEKQNVKARQVALYMENESVEVEPGAMSYFKGNIEMVSGITTGNMLGRAFASMTTKESMSKPKYAGTGTLVLEPSFNHFVIINMVNEELIVDKGMFYCAQSTVEVKPIMQKNLSSAIVGGEGIFQIQLKGTGLVILESTVPTCEINVIEMQNETLKVDGNFALLRTGGIEFTVERSAKSLVGSALSGEGLVNVFRGTGSVWLAPTIKIYNALNSARLTGGGTKSMDMNTSKS